MRRVAAQVAKGLAGLVAVVVIGDLVLVHPNDARIDFPAGPARPVSTTPTQRRASLLLSRLEHAEDLTAEAYQEKRQTLLKALPDYALPASSRFVSPYQVYVPVGSYPLRLDARDGVFVPAGAKLTIKPQLAGKVELRFAAYSPKSAATLTVQAGTSAVQTLGLPPPPTPWVDYSSRLYNDWLRFWRVDPTSGLEVWEEKRLPATLAAADTVTLACGADARFGCLISDVEFDEPAPERRQNVLFILVDTLRGDAIHTGHAPNMAALADGGQEFTHALAPGNMTSPSTNGLLSCRRPSQLATIAFSYGVGPELRDSYYREGHVSFPGRLLKAGYDTAMIGNVSVISEIYGVGINHGFAEQVSLETDGYDTPAISREAIRWLETHGDHPFFLYLHYNGPHAPYRPPLRDLWQVFTSLRQIDSYAKALLWLYQGEVAYTDRYLAPVLEALRSLGLADHTTIVLTADHGDQHRPHRFLGNTAAPDFEGAYFDHGATLLDDEIRVPLVIKRPGAAPGRIDDYVSTLDLGPTLIDMVGAGDAAGCAGQSLVPFLKGQATTTERLRPLTSEGYRARMVLFDGRYKYIRTYEPTDKKIYTVSGWSGRPTLWLVPEQLFDLRADPDEERDLAATAPALLARGRDLYKQLYNIRDAYELVVETPQAQPFVATFPPGTTLRYEEGDGKIETTPAGIKVVGGGRERSLIEARFAPGAVARPVVEIAGVRVEVGETSTRLPLGADPAALPPETGGRYTLLAPGHATSAYLRRVEDDGQTNRRLLTGNPAFEKVLREWGYLNDK